MKSRAATLAVVVAGLAVTGFVLRPLDVTVWADLEDSRPGVRGNPAGAALERMVVPGMLGGFRAAVADLLWLEASGRAAEQDLAATETLLHWVTVIDSRPLYFWLNAARTTAYDMPAWRIEAAGGYARMPARVRERYRTEQAERALRLLDEAKQFHPASAALWIEQANIQLNQLGDMAGAAASYRRAWEQPAAPYFAGRLHAEMLRRLGRKAEALAWLVQLHPHLPPQEDAAGAARVLGRIRDLERELGVPPGQAYQPPGR